MISGKRRATSNELKIAIVHDYIKEYGGAERVLEELIRIFPNSTVYTSVYLPNYLGPHKDRFNNYAIRTSFLQLFPFKARLVSPFRLLSPLAFKSFDFSGYDVVFVSQTGAYFPNIIQKSKIKSQKLVCYCHTPPRYLYGYATAREWKKDPVFKILGEAVNHFLRLIDFRSAQNVDYFIANSKNVKERIRKFYRKDSQVIYPPVNIDSKLKIQSRLNSDQNSKLQVKNQKNNYFLAGGRLARPKNIDLIIKTFIKLNLPLKIFGRGFAGFEEEIKNQILNIKNINKRSKIELLGEVSDEEKLYLMKNAKAYVFASEDEDFGITPVEAMSMGIPVIAYKSGGVVESVIEGKTGVFFDELTAYSLASAIRSFGKIDFNKRTMIKHAQNFSKERFATEIKKFITRIK